MAEVLGCDAAAFRDEWTRTAIVRQTGGYPGGVEENVREICRALGVEVDETRMRDALARRAALYERWFHPRPGAIETLRELRARGIPIGLISMCAPDTPPMWRTSELAPLVDVAIFSSESGLRKPEPAIYRLACERLGVEPERCLYCGDGAYGELTGATAVGMTAYLIRPEDLDVAEALTPEPEKDWQGLMIEDLRELLALV
jgi:putative hydrolase of the HAD superfamily